MDAQHVFKIVVISLVSAALAACSPSSHRDAQKGVATRGGNILVIGHRGAAGLSPENTLAAFKTAFDMGVDAVEMDVQLTRGGELVVYHDYTLKPEITRTANGEWLDEWTSLAIKNLSLAELKRYDVGRLDPYTFYAERYPDQIPADGETIPTLQAVIDLRRLRDSHAELWIEIKTSPLAPQVSSRPEDVAAAVVQVVRRHRLTQDVKILAFDWQALQEVRQRAPEMATVYLTNTSPRMDTIQRGTAGPSPWTAGLDIDHFEGSIPAMVAAAGGRFWAPRYNQITTEDIDAARHLGIRVMAWTPDGENELRDLIALRVDGIITNRPDRLLTLLDRN